MPTDHVKYFEAMALALEAQAIFYLLYSQAMAIDPHAGADREANAEQYLNLERGALEVAAGYRRMARNAASAGATFSESAR